MGCQLIVLGCGGSAGVPAIGNWWGACDPAEPRNIRTRPSVCIMSNNTLIVVDAGPDFLWQMNREKLGCPDALFITHAHSDHINGIDEFRILQRLNKQRRFPLYALSDTLQNLQKRLDYMFQTSEDGFYPAVFDGQAVNPQMPLTIGDIKLLPFVQMHGSVRSMGLRVGDTAYCTDVKQMDDDALKSLAGIKTWIVDAAGHKSTTNPVHMGIDEIIELNESRIGASKVYLTHLPPTMDYRTLMTELPAGYEPAYDGLTLTIAP